MTTDHDVERWSRWKAWCYSLCSANPRSNREIVRLAAPGAGDHVVDVGCGAGAAVRQAAARGARATGVDPSPAMVAGARRRSRGVDAVTFEVGDAAHLPLDDGSATVVWAIATYHHWPDARSGLADIHRVLAPGGRLLIGERRVRRAAGHGLTEHQADETAALLQELGYRAVARRAVRLRFATMLVLTATA